jgi:hypothetical protein
VQVKAVNALVALSDIASEYQIPIGVEAASQGKGHEINISLREATVREALNAMIEQDSRYEWKAEGGVINFIPKSDRDDLSAAALDATLGQFNVEKGTALIDIKGDLVACREVKDKLDRAKVTARVGGFMGQDFHKAGLLAQHV